MRSFKLFSFCAWTAEINMRPPKSWWCEQQQLQFFSFCVVHIFTIRIYVCMYVRVWVFRLFSWLHSPYTSSTAVEYLAIYDVRVIATSLAYEQDWNRDKFEIDFPLSIPFQEAAAAAYVYVSNGKRPRMIRVALHQFIKLWDVVWYVSGH